MEEQCRRAEGFAAAEARRLRLGRAAKRISDGEDVPAVELADDEAGPRALFRDAGWENAELKYNTLAIDNLNELCRAYNIMAPAVARKPLFSLRRELDRCFADVAPQVAQEIRGRARRPVGPGKLGIARKPEGSALAEKLGMGEHRKVAVYESEKPLYGFMDFWRDMFGGKKGLE